MKYIFYNFLYLYTPTDLYNSVFLPSKFFANRYLEKRLNLPEQEQKVWKVYLKYMFAFPVSCEKSFHSLFQFPKVSAVFPLETIFPD